MKITIETIPQRHMRYKSLGDYYRDGKDIIIQIADTGDKKYNYTLALHEFIEMLLCDVGEISFDDIDDFDFNYEGEEPGSDKKAPYFQQHAFATKFEKLLAKHLTINWKEYEEQCKKTEKTYEQNT